MKPKTFNYRSNGIEGGPIYTGTLQEAFNYIARELVEAGVVEDNWRALVRLEGHVKHEGKTYPAMAQGSILVVAGPLPAENRIYF
jgi:hypothetical protein